MIHRTPMGEGRKGGDVRNDEKTFSNVRMDQTNSSLTEQKVKNSTSETTPGRLDDLDSNTVSTVALVLVMLPA